MIKLNAIRIEEFRGIREIELPFNGSSFAIHGPNGSGKSGVVDAIDFVLTGNIARLSGVGTKNVSVAKHGPHVHRRDDPGAARVTLTFTDLESGQTGVATRTVAKPDEIKLKPDTPELRSAVAVAQQHPELTLSRREIIKYIVSKPADRAQEVQSLLKLDRLGTFRKLLKAVLGKSTAEKKSADEELATAEQSFKGHLDISTLLTSEIAREVNARRKILGADDLGEITIDTDFLQGITADNVARPYDLKTARRETSELQRLLSSTDSLEQKRLALHAVIAELRAEPNLLDALRHRTLVEQGLANVQSSECPLCDTEWNSIDSLREHLQVKLDRSSAAEELRRRINEAAENYRSALTSLADNIQRGVPVAEIEGDGELHHLMTDWAREIRDHAQKQRKFDTVVLLTDELDVRVYMPSEQVREKFALLVRTLEEKPDLSETDGARTFLTVAKDRWSRVRVTRAKREKAEAAHTNTSIIYEEYCKVSDSALTSLYEAVEADFSSYYKRLNIDDEAGFKAEFKPQSASLELAVEFYGHGMFPPTAYHSEGHQDGMGVCLYLALVKRLLGDSFSYAVLDDVVMSVDVNHKRQFCELLIEEFSDVQFIITTHDSVWARQMESAGLITSKGQARFYGWSVDAGPTYEQGDIWEKIEDDLQRNDVPGAAHKLRRRLEAACSDLAHSLKGQVSYRADNKYDLSELLDAVKARHTRLLKKASTAAKSWGDESAVSRIEELELKRADTVRDQNAESWLINPLVHNNDWADASVADFRPILESTRAFLDLFTCENSACEGWIYVSGFPGDALRCGCGNYNLTLRNK